jgi:tryptophanyl-tRNA synthetase
MIEIMAVARSVEPEEIEREFEGSGYGDFKAAVAEAVIDWLTPVRERYDELRADADELEGILEAGADKARAIARTTLADVRDVMGVGPVKRSVGPAA